MRTIWNGSISFGLVSIPIGLALATQREDISFRTLHRECGTPIKQKRWCPVHERDVESDELVRGWEVAKGQFVVVEDADLEAIETLFVNEDVKDHDEIDAAVSTSEVREPELELAKQIIASLSAPFDPAELRSEYRESLRELLEAKLAGHEIEVPEAPEPTPVVDLMEALRASVAQAKKQ